MIANKRYYASLVHKTWYDGLSLCKRFNMNYATLASAGESTYLASLTNQSFWIGVTDSAQEGVFVNYDDKNIVNSFLTWAAGQPDNANGKEDCVYVGQNTFNDYDCEKFLLVLCEIKLPEDPVEIVENLLEIEPPNNLFDSIGKSGTFIIAALFNNALMHFRCFLVNNDKKYYASRIVKPYHNGLSLCLRYDMDLVIFESKNESIHLSTLLDDEVYLTGLSDMLVEGTYRSYRGLGENVTSFVNWSLGEPNNAGDEDCAVIGKTGSNDKSCFTSQKILCERRIPKQPATKVDKSLAPEPAANRFDYISESGIIESFGKWFFLKFDFVLENSQIKYFVSKLGMSWDSARTMCHHHDMSFVTFKTSAEALRFSNTGTVPGTSTWIGVNDILNEGTYVNYYGKPDDVGSVLNWLPGEPNNGLGITNEDCMDVLNKNYNDADCGLTTIRAGCMSKSLFSI